MCSTLILQIWELIAYLKDPPALGHPMSHVVRIICALRVTAPLLAASASPLGRLVPDPIKYTAAATKIAVTLAIVLVN